MTHFIAIVRVMTHTAAGSYVTHTYSDMCSCVMVRSWEGFYEILIYVYSHGLKLSTIEVHGWWTYLIFFYLLIESCPGACPWAFASESPRRVPPSQLLNLHS